MQANEMHIIMYFFFLTKYNYVTPLDKKIVTPVTYGECMLKLL